MLIIIIRILIILLTVAVAGLFLHILSSAKEYDDMIAPLDEKEFMLKDIYCIGFKIMDMMNINLKTNSANELREKIKILYGDKYAEFYLRVYYAQRISLSFLVLVFGLVISCMASGSDGIILVFLCLLITGAIYYYFLTLAERHKSK